MKYRAEIDGLRAIAVVPVILFHAGSDLFSGGFVGVDVFFVISGYLITSILVADIENNRFRIADFYERRARRILPALLFLVFTTNLAATLFFKFINSVELREISNSSLSSLFFYSNIYFWRTSGYFAATSDLLPFLHTWSLAVEEQYYLLFPIFLCLAWRLGVSGVFWMIVAFAAISLALSEWGWRNQPTANFYLAPTRAWELFAGSIAAFVVRKWGVKSNNALSVVGLAAILFAIYAYDENTPFPSIYALVPVLGVVLLVIFADKETLVAKLLSNKLFVGIGLVSYSAYLWHQPILVVLRYINFHPVSVSFFSSAIALGIVLLVSLLSYKYVELPFRRRKYNLAHLAIFFCVALSGVLIVHKFASNKKLSDASEYAIDLAKISYNRRFEAENDLCWFGDKQADGATRVLLLGNSHARMLIPSLGQSFADANILGVHPNPYKITKNDDDLLLKKSDYSEITKEAYWSFICGLASKSKWTILSYRYVGYVNDEVNNYFYSSSPISIDVQKLNFLRRYLERLGSCSEKLIIVGPVPEAPNWGPNLNRAMLGNTVQSKFSIYEKNSTEVVNLLKEYASRSPMTYYLDVASYLCETDYCATYYYDDINREKLAYYYDDDHLSSLGSRRLVGAIVKLIAE